MGDWYQLSVMAGEDGQRRYINGVLVEEKSPD